MRFFLLAALAAYLVQATVSFDALPLPLLAWTCLGAIAAFADPGVSPDAVASVTRRSTRVVDGPGHVWFLITRGSRRCGSRSHAVHDRDVTPLGGQGASRQRS